VKDVAAQLVQLRRQGVRFELDGASVRMTGPRGVLTSEVRSGLARRKPELVRVLESEREHGLEAEAFNNVAGLLTLAYQRLTQSIPPPLDRSVAIAHERSVHGGRQ